MQYTLDVKANFSSSFDSKDATRRTGDTYVQVIVIPPDKLM